jgi:hypothetical protein
MPKVKSAFLVPSSCGGMMWAGGIETALEAAVWSLLRIFP